MAKMVQRSLYDKNTFIVQLSTSQVCELDQFRQDVDEKEEYLLTRLICEQLGD